LFLKPTYFAVGLALLAAGCVLHRVRAQRILALFCGFGIICSTTLWFLGFDIKAVGRDMAMLGAARWSGFGLEHSLLERAAESSFEVVVLLICAALSPLVRTAAPRGALRHRDLILATLVSVCGIVLLWTNCQNAGLPLNAIFAIVLAARIRPSESPRPSPERPNLLRALMLILTMTVAIPPLAADAFGVGYAACQTRWPLGNQEGRVAARRLSPLVTQKVFAEFISDGLALLRSASGPQERLATFGAGDLFSYALERKPYRGGCAYMVSGFTFSDRHSPSPEWLLGGADVVMVPKDKDTVPQWNWEALDRLYGKFLQERFKLSAENSQWSLYRKISGTADAADPQPKIR
jgi:hypothetical protein